MSIASSTSSVSVSTCTGVDTLGELGTGVPSVGVSLSLLVAVSAFSKAAQISLCCSSSSSSVRSSSTVSSATTQFCPRRAGEPLVGVRGGVPLGRGGGVGVAGGVPWGRGGGELKQGEPGGSGGWNWKS